jgi:hypothetical protein
MLLYGLLTGQVAVAASVFLNYCLWFCFLNEVILRGGNFRRMAVVERRYRNEFARKFRRAFLRSGKDQTGLGLWRAHEGIVISYWGVVVLLLVSGTRSAVYCRPSVAYGASAACSRVCALMRSTARHYQACQVQFYVLIEHKGQFFGCACPTAWAIGKTFRMLICNFGTAMENP